MIEKERKVYIQKQRERRHIELKWVKCEEESEEGERERERVSEEITPLCWIRVCLRKLPIIE